MSPLPGLARNYDTLSPTAVEGVKKYTASRKDAKAQRLAKKNPFVCFADFATLRLSVRCSCLFGNFFTAAVAVG